MWVPIQRPIAQSFCENCEIKLLLNNKSLVIFILAQWNLGVCWRYNHPDFFNLCSINIRLSVLHSCHSLQVAKIYFVRHCLSLLHHSTYSTHPLHYVQVEQDRGPVNPIFITSRRCLDYCYSPIRTICRPQGTSCRTWSHYCNAQGVF